MAIRFFFGGLLLLISWPALGQIDESDTLGLQYRAALTGNLQSGNLEALTAVARLELSAAPTRHWAVKTQNNARYQAFFGRKADNDFNSQNFVYLGQQQRWYPFGMVFLATNFRRKIDFRWFAGPGLTWQALNTQGQTIKLSLATVYESSQFAGQAYTQPAYDGSNRIRTWRVTCRLYGQHRLPGNRFRWSYEAYFQPAFDRSDNYRWLADLSAEATIWKGLAFTAHFLYTYENVTPIPVRQKDLILTFGFSVRGRR